MGSIFLRELLARFVDDPDVKVVNWNPAYRKGSLLSHGQTYHHTLMSEDASVY